VPDAGAVDGLAGQEVIATVEDHVGIGDPFPEGFAFEAAGNCLDADFGIDAEERRLRRPGLCLADAVLGVQDLTLQVGQIDGVAVGEGDPAKTGGGEIESRR
jgi:hypothetical protein